VREDASGAREILGLDPFYLANQGLFIAFVPERETARALRILSKHSVGAVRIGQVLEKRRGMVTIRSR
jgi:hydrogenase expression/formation protein HypE